ncbi:helix-turn-helix domain-containing protein [Kroppenstedtia sanguinis]|uniref:Helix-turn-helix domain-containing protein n=1 Tax=Kroppenstedtia sanguinis TaxID=1380684 RepID=A0ABW4CEQ4_9BACL
MEKDKKNQPIIGGIFGTRTEVDAEGNVIQKDDFHLRLYWELFEPEVQKKALKGNAFKVFLFIAMHMDKNGEGWPSQRRIAERLGINKDTVGNAVERLEKYGLIVADQTRKPDGTWGNTVYKLRFSPRVVEEDVPEKAVSEKTGHGEEPHEIKDSTVSEKTGDGKTGSGKPGHKEDPPLNKDKDDIKTINKDDQRAREEKETTSDISLDNLDLSYLPDTYPEEIRTVVESRPELFRNVSQALKITERIRWAHGKASKQMGYEIQYDYKLSAQVLREVIVRCAQGKIEKDLIGYYHNALTDRLCAKAFERERQAEQERLAAEFKPYNWVK